MLPNRNSLALPRLDPPGLEGAGAEEDVGCERGAGRCKASEQAGCWGLVAMPVAQAGLAFEEEAGGDVTVGDE